MSPSTLATLRAKRKLAWVGMPEGGLAMPTTCTPLCVHDLAGLGELAVATLIRRHVDHDRALGHALDHRCGQQHGGLAPRHRRRGDDDVGAPDLLGQRGALAVELLGGQLAGVAADALGRHAGVEEGGAQALGLFLGGGPDVVGLDHGAEPARRGDRLQAGDADAHDEHLGRRHRPRRRHEHGEELGQVLRRRQPGPVARDGRLGAQGVHALGPADARQEVEAEDGRLLGGQRAHGVFGLGHAEEAQQCRALGQTRHVLGARWVHPDHQPGTRERRRRVGGHGRPGVGVGAVAERGLRAGAGLHADLPARADQLLDHVGDESHAALAWTGLGGDLQFHGCSV